MDQESGRGLSAVRGLLHAGRVSEGPTDAAARRQTLGRRFRRKREALKLSQRDAADRAGVPQTAVSRAESGDELPEEVLLELVRAYRMVVLPGPIDPVRRLAFVAQRSASHAAFPAPASGTYGKPAKKAA